MPEFLQSIHVLAQSVDILANGFILAVLAILLIFGFRGLCWPKTPRSNNHHADPRHTQLLRKTPF